MPEFGPRYTAQGVVGVGAYATVYKVVDRWLGVVRALKLSTRKGRTRQLKQEYRRLSEFRHPNIVKAYDFGVAENGMPFFTQDLIAGKGLGQIELPVGNQTSLHVTLQILDALSVLHARGLVHRDVKPDNLIVSGTGDSSHARLIDLGMVIESGKQDDAAGTLPYMAPEVARGEYFDGRADIFSIGVVLFEQLIPDGIPKTIEGIAEFHQRGFPQARTLNPGIGDKLSDWLSRCLQLDPGERFQTATEAADALVKAAPFSISRGTTRGRAERTLSAGAVCHRPTSLKRMTRWAANLRQGNDTGLFLVEGATGVGKTPLLRELAIELNLRGWQVLNVRTRREGASPIDRLLKVTGDTDPLPAGSQNPQTAQTMPDASSAASHIGRTFSDTRTALIIDDFQRAGVFALETIRRLARASTQSSLALFVACEPDQDRSEKDRLNSESGLRVLLEPDETIQMRPLSVKQVRKLAEHRLQGLQLPQTALSRLTSDSNGMPSLVERTLAGLLAEGTIRQTEQAYEFAGGLYQPASHAGQSQTVAILDGLKPIEKAALEAAAVIGAPITYAAVAALLGVSTSEVEHALHLLSRIQLLVAWQTDEGRTFRFVRHRVRRAVYASLEEGERRRLHDLAASCTKDRSEQVWHLLRGSNDSAAIEAAIEAADAAVRGFSDNRAIDYLERAHTRLSPNDSAYAPTISFELGTLFARRGELGAAVRWLELALSQDLTERQRRLCDLRRAKVLLTQGRLSQTTLKISPLKPTSSTQECVEYIAVRSLALLKASRAGEVLEILDGADVKALRLDSSEIDLELGLLRAQALAQLSRTIDSIGEARRCKRIALRLGAATATAQSWTIIGQALMEASRFRGASIALSRGLSMARRSGNRLQAAIALRQIGNLKLRRGSLTDSVQRYDRSLELCRAVEARTDESACLHNLGVVSTLTGNFKGALKSLGDAVELCGELDNKIGAAFGHIELGHCLFRLRQFELASTHLAQGLEIAASLGAQSLVVEGRALEIWMAAASDGRVGLARLKAFEAETASQESPAQRALSLTCLAEAALLSKEYDYVLSIESQIGDLIERFGLFDFRAASMALRGNALLGLDAYSIEGRSLLNEGVEMGARAGFVPFEIELRHRLGALGAGTEEGFEHLTCAMERLQLVTSQVPEQFLSRFINQESFLALRRRFQNECQRVGIAIS